MKVPAAYLVLVFPLVAALSACDSISGADPNDLTVSFAVAEHNNANSSMMTAVADPVTLNGHTIDLQSADVVFTDIQLDRVNSHENGADDLDSEGDTDSEGDSDEEETLRLGASTIQLPLDGGVITPISVAVPEGTYESIEMKISTIRLRGIYDGNPFDVTLALNTKVEFEFSPLLIIDSADDRPNITIQIDPSIWFLNGGSLIDPQLIATNVSLREKLRAQIRSSFHAFEDSNRDGHDGDRDSDRDSH